MSRALYCALLHHPMRHREGGTATTAVTTIDVHDIARSARSFDARGFFVVTPVEPQRTLVERILHHWREGAGQRRMPDRKEALSICRVAETLAEAIGFIQRDTGASPELWATAAGGAPELPRLAYAEARQRLLEDGAPVLLLFGTGHGIHGDLLERADALLAPIAGAPQSGYNHLSVRAAAAITLDRLRATPEGAVNR